MDWLPIVVGTMMFLYIKSYNRIARMYFESERSLTWNDFFTKVVPVAGV